MRCWVLVLAGCGGAAAPAAPRAACRGDRVISSQAEIEAVAACGAVDGDVAIRSAAPLDLSALVALEEVRGDLTIGPTFDVGAVHCEGLRRVTGTLRIVSNAAATGAFLPRLEHAGAVEIGGNVSIGNISAPALREVAGDLVVEDNPALEFLAAGALTRVGGTLRIRRNGILGVVELAALTSAGAVVIEGAGLPPGLADTLAATAVTRR